MAKPKRSPIAVVPRTAATLERVDEPPPVTQHVKHTYVVRHDNRDWHRIIYATGCAIALVILAVAQVV